MVCCVIFLHLVLMDFCVFGTAGGDVERFIDFVFSRKLSAVE
jgi:hypothetical protein